MAKKKKTIGRVTVQRFSESEIEKEIAVVLKDALRQSGPKIYKALASGLTRDEMINRIMEVTSRAEGYAATLTDTGLSIIGRERIADTAKDLGLTWYRYIGGIIQTSRDFCIERDGGYYTQEEVEEWGELAQSDPWDGAIEGTNSENIFSFCGGWNCRHDLIPVLASSVPDDVKGFNTQQQEEARADADRLNEIDVLTDQLNDTPTNDEFDKMSEAEFIEYRRNRDAIINRLRELRGL